MPPATSCSHKRSPAGSIVPARIAARSRRAASRASGLCCGAGNPRKSTRPPTSPSPSPPSGRPPPQPPQDLPRQQHALRGIPPLPQPVIHEHPSWHACCPLLSTAGTDGRIHLEQTTLAYSCGHSAASPAELDAHSSRHSPQPTPSAATARSTTRSREHGRLVLAPRRGRGARTSPSPLSTSMPSRRPPRPRSRSPGSDPTGDTPSSPYPERRQGAVPWRGAELRPRPGPHRRQSLSSGLTLDAIKPLPTTAALESFPRTRSPSVHP
jgi:hypothetical protein